MQSVSCKKCKKMGKKYVLDLKTNEGMGEDDMT